MSPLKYLMQQLSFKASDWTMLSEKDKDDLKEYARIEMGILGIEVTG